MRTAILILALPLSLAVSTGHAQVINPGCTLIGNHFDCPLLVGFNYYEAVFDRDKPYLVEHIRIHNDTGAVRYLQGVSANASDRSAWGEFSIYLDHFATRQDQPGIGEVGAIDWNPFLKHIPGISFDPRLEARGLKVPPGSTIFLHNNAEAMLNGGIDTATITYGATFVSSALALRSMRQPPIDLPILCNGSDQWTAWDPWLNTDAQAWKTDTVNLYTVAPVLSHTVDAACLYILRTNGQIRWTYCANVNRRGVVRFPRQKIRPGESVAGQARHRCSAPGIWDWAAWFYVW